MTETTVKVVAATPAQLFAYRAGKLFRSDFPHGEVDRQLIDLLEEDSLLKVGLIRDRIKSYRHTMFEMPEADHNLKFLAWQLAIEQFYNDWRDHVEARRNLGR